MCVMLVLFCLCTPVCCSVWVVCVCERERECVYVRRVGPVFPLHSCLLSCVVGVCVCVRERESAYVGPVLPLHLCCSVWCMVCV